MKRAHKRARVSPRLEQELRNRSALNVAQYAASIILPHLVDLLKDPAAHPEAVVAAIDPAMTILGCLRGMAYMSIPRDRP